MNIFSNVGITELVLILLLALLVVGPERLPELARQLGKMMRDVRKMYENLASDLGPELASLQESTQDLRDSVESVRSIPKDMVQQVVQAAELDETMGELQGVKDSVDQMGKTLSSAKTVVQDPVTAAVDSVRGSLTPDDAPPEEQGAGADTQEEAATTAEESKPEAQEALEQRLTESDDLAEEPKPSVEETGEESETLAENIADEPDSEVRAIGGASPSAQVTADEEPAPSLQEAAETGPAEQDHE
jgi:sec-independent protein translocase protein TatB